MSVAPHNATYIPFGVRTNSCLTSLKPFPLSRPKVPAQGQCSADEFDDAGVCAACRPPCDASEFRWRPCHETVDADCATLFSDYQLVFTGNTEGDGSGRVFSGRSDPTALFGSEITGLADPGGCGRLCNFYSACEGFVVETVPGEATTTCVLLAVLGSASGEVTSAYSFSFSKRLVRDGHSLRGNCRRYRPWVKLTEMSPTREIGVS